MYWYFHKADSKNGLASTYFKAKSSTLPDYTKSLNLGEKNVESENKKLMLP